MQSLHFPPFYLAVHQIRSACPFTQTCNKAHIYHSSHSRTRYGIRIRAREYNTGHEAHRSITGLEEQACIPYHTYRTPAAFKIITVNTNTNTDTENPNFGKKILITPNS